MTSCGMVSESRLWHRRRTVRPSRSSRTSRTYYASSTRIRRYSRATPRHRASRRARAISFRVRAKRRARTTDPPFREGWRSRAPERIARSRSARENPYRPQKLLVRLGERQVPLRGNRGTHRIRRPRRRAFALRADLRNLPRIASIGFLAVQMPTPEVARHLTNCTDRRPRTPCAPSSRVVRPSRLASDHLWT
jgi:hypothetical protein